MKIVLEAADSTLQEGDSVRVAATLLDGAGEVVPALPAGAMVVWASSDSSVATIRDGVVKAEAPGEVRILVSAGDVQASISLLVLPTPASIRIVSGDAQKVWAGAQTRDSLVVQVLDKRGGAVQGVDLSSSVEQGGGSLAPASLRTDSAGIASFAWMTGSAGVQAVTISVVQQPGIAVTAAATALAAPEVQVSGYSPSSPLPAVEVPLSPYVFEFAVSVVTSAALDSITYGMLGRAERRLTTRETAGSYSADATERVTWGETFIEVFTYSREWGRSSVRIPVTFSFPTREYTLTRLSADGSIDSDALGLNDAGDIVGYVELTNGQRRAALWRGGTLIDISLGVPSTAVAINRSGQIVG